MQKCSNIATISLIAVLLYGCSGDVGIGPAIITKSDLPAADVSAGTNGKGKISYTYQLGPISLPAKKISEEYFSAPVTMNFHVEEAVWITGVGFELVDAEENPLPGNLIHEILLINHGEANGLCTSKQAGNPFAAATSSLKPIELPEGLGYPVVETDPLEARVFLKNPTEQDYFSVYLKFTVSGEVASEAKFIKDVLPVMIDVDPCEHSPLSLAPGQFLEKNNTAFIPETGKIVKAYGLLQDYGVSLSLSTNEEAEPFWHGLAEIDESYRIVDLPPFENNAGVAIERGGKLNMKVVYNNVSGNWFEGATGAAILYLARSEEESAPTGDAVEVQKTLIK